MERIESRRRLEALFAEHAAAVRAYAARRIAPDLVDDVCSDVFVTAWRRLDDVPADALPWLLGCARRIIANHRRSATRLAALRVRLAGERPRPDAPMVLDSLLATALDTLSHSDRELLLLVAWEGLDTDRAARVLGCSSRACAMRLHRARRRLATALDEADRDQRPRTEALT